MPLAVVTGASTGIGFHTAGQAVKGYDVVCACRNPTRAKEVTQSIRDWYGKGRPLSVEFRELDLASFASVQTFAAGMVARAQPLDVLVCNAGVNSALVPQEPENQLSQDGVDLLYQTNFLSHLLLVLLLLPLLRAAYGRVLSVSSVVHRGASREHFRLIKSVREPYTSLYGISKLAQILATHELHRRFTRRNLVSFHCVNPGGVSSDIWRDDPGWKQLLFKGVLATPETAAQTVVRAAECWDGRPPASPRYWNGYMGAGKLSAFEYWSPWSARARLVESEPSLDARDPELARQVWEESIEAISSAGVDIDMPEDGFEKGAA